jgi:cytochrome c5
MRYLRWLLLTFLLACAPARAADPVPQLDLDRRCGQCHDASGTLTTEHWLERLEELGPIDKLSPAEQKEALGLLRHHGWEIEKIAQMAGDRHVFEEKCSLCHSADRAFIRDLTPEQWRTTLERMRARAPDWISEADLETIATFLKAGAPGVQKPEHKLVSASPAEVFRVRCSACHTLERAYLYVETHRQDTQWAPVVERMRLKAPEWISPPEAALITEYLDAQKPLL